MPLDISVNILYYSTSILFYIAMIIHYVFRLNLSGFHYKNGADTKVQHAEKHEKYRTDIEKTAIRILKTYV